jgi:thiol-disulfide isomerase/thioredoxin
VFFVYSSKEVVDMIKREFPNKKVAIQDSWGAWWIYCPSCDKLKVELDPWVDVKRCPFCGKDLDIVKTSRGVNA